MAGAPPVRRTRTPARRLRLRDGSEVVIRPIRPSDKARLQAGFERLSEESRYSRFLSPINRLTPEQLAYLTEVDHHDHEALVAVHPDDGHGLAVARFVRDRARPEYAEVAVTVADDWQGRGLGTMLLELLSDRAREEGVTHFTALVLADNADMLDLVAALGVPHRVDAGAGTVELDVVLPPAGTGEHLTRVLRSAAAGDLRPAGRLAGG